MGDYNFAIGSNVVRSHSPLEFHSGSNSTSLFFSDHIVPHTMQDELLLDQQKAVAAAAVKQQQQQQQQQLSSSSSSAAVSSQENSSEQNDYTTTSSPTSSSRKSKDEETNGGGGSHSNGTCTSNSAGSVLQQQQADKKSEQPSSLIANAVTSPLHLGFSEAGSNVPAAAITSSSTTSSFWSTAAAADDAFIQGIPAAALNGTLAFQNFPPSPNAGPPPPHQLYNMNAGLGPGPQQLQQRRPLTVAGHSFPHAAVARQAAAAAAAAAQQAQSNLFVPSSTKAYTTSWSSPQQGNTTWSTGPGPNQQTGLSPWNSIHHARRAAGGGLSNVNPITPLKKTGGLGQQPQQSAAALVISPSRYRRSTSFPSKNFPHPAANVAPNLTFEITGADDSRDVNSLLPFQDRLLTANTGGPLDTMRVGFEQCLNDMMRFNGDNQEHLKARSYGRRRGKSPFFPGLEDNHLLEDGHLDQSVPSLSSPSRSSPRSQGSADLGERYSRKVFVGGLPPDIDEEEITQSFRRFGPLVVDWPHKAESKSYFPPKGYAFLLFQDESSVQNLIDACIQDDDKLYLCVSSPTIKDKPVQIRPWRLSDADFVLDGSLTLDPRKTVFVGGVPRPLKAVELAMIMDRLYGGVCYAGIDTDPELKYPKGAGRVAFSNQQSYIAAISARFVQLQHGDIDKRVEVKPYVLDDQLCDECQGVRCGGKFAPFFCANVTCLQYYCEQCWATIHSRAGREFHKPLVKEGADRPRTVPFRWC